MKIILSAIILSALFFSSGRAHDDKALIEEMLNKVEKTEMELNQIKDEDNYSNLPHCYTNDYSSGGCDVGYHEVSHSLCPSSWFWIYNKEYCYEHWYLHQQNDDSAQIVRIQDEPKVGLVVHQSSEKLAFLEVVLDPWFVKYVKRVSK